MKLRQVALRSTDLDRSREFYARLTGTDPTGLFDPPGLLFFDLDGTRLLLDANAPASMLYLEVDDVHTAIEGHDVVSEPHVIFEHEDDTLGPAGKKEWQAFVKDPDDNLVGLISFE